jgi:glutamine synthetase
MAKTMIYPAAVRYMNELAENVERLQELSFEDEGSRAMLQKVNNGLNDLNLALDELRTAVLDEQGDSVIDNARHVQDNVLPAMTKIRDAVDYLERYVADDYWPLPIYREMLFVK